MGKQKFLVVAWSVVTVWPNVALSALDRNDAFIGYTEGASSSLSRDHHPAQEESLLGRQNGEENIQDDFVKRLGKIREKQLGFLKSCENAHKDALGAKTRTKTRSSASVGPKTASAQRTHISCSRTAEKRANGVKMCS